MDSLKKNIIHGFGLIPSLENMEDYDLILVTALGLISGTLVDETDDANPTANMLSETAENIACIYREDRNISADTYLDGNDGYIPLKNVTIQYGPSTFNTPFLCVFFDQIIGVSVGKLNRK